LAQAQQCEIKANEDGELLEFENPTNSSSDNILERTTPNEGNTFDDVVDATKRSGFEEEEATGVLLNRDSGTAESIATRLTELSAEGIVDEIPVVDILAGIGFEAVTIATALQRHVDDKFQQAEVGVDVTLETIGNFFPPLGILSLPIEVVINSVLERKEKEYVAEQYAEIYDDFHGNATSLENLVSGHLNNYEAYLLNHYKRSIDEILMESEDIRKLSLSTLDATSKSVIDNLNQRLKESMNAALTPVAKLPKFHGKTLYDNHYELLDNVCSASYKKLIDELTSESVNTLTIKEHSQCYQREMLARLKLMARFADINDADFEQVREYVNKKKRKIYETVATSANSQRFTNIHKYYFQSVVGGIKKDLLANKNIRSVYDGLKSEYEDISFLDARNDAPVLADKHNDTAGWEEIQFTFDYNNPQTRTCKKSHINPAYDRYLHSRDFTALLHAVKPRPPKRLCDEWGAWQAIPYKKLKVDLSASPLAKLKLEEYLPLAANSTSTLVRNMKTSQVVEEASEYYVNMLMALSGNPVKTVTVLTSDKQVLEAIPGFSKHFKVDNTLTDNRLTNESFTTYAISLNEKLPEGMVLKVHDALETLSERQVQDSCGKASYRDPRILHKSDLGNSWCGSDATGITENCRDIKVQNINSTRYYYDTHNDQCKVDYHLKLTYEHSGFLTGWAHGDFRSFKITFTDKNFNRELVKTLSSIQIQQMKSLETYLALDELLPFKQPNLWNAKEAKAIHLGMVSYIQDQGLLRNKISSTALADFRKQSKSVIFALLQSFVDPVTKENIKQRIKALGNTNYSTSRVRRIKNVPGFAINSDNKYVLVKDFVSTLESLGAQGDYAGALRSSGNTELSYSYPLTEADKPLALGLYLPYMSLVKKVLSDSHEHTDNTFYSTVKGINLTSLSNLGRFFATYIHQALLESQPLQLYASALGSSDDKFETLQTIPFDASGYSKTNDPTVLAPLLLARYNLEALSNMMTDSDYLLGYPAALGEHLYALTGSDSTLHLDDDTVVPRDHWPILNGELLAKALPLHWISKTVMLGNPIGHAHTSDVDSDPSFYVVSKDVINGFGLDLPNSPYLSGKPSTRIPLQGIDRIEVTVGDYKTAGSIICAMEVSNLEYYVNGDVNTSGIEEVAGFGNYRACTNGNLETQSFKQESRIKGITVWTYEGFVTGISFRLDVLEEKPSSPDQKHINVEGLMSQLLVKFQKELENKSNMPFLPEFVSQLAYWSISQQVLLESARAEIKPNN